MKNSTNISYEERDDAESTFESSPYESELWNKEFKVLSRKQKNALCMKRKRAKKKKRKQREKKIDTKMKLIVDFDADGTKRYRWIHVSGPFLRNHHCKNCSHQVLSELLILCALHPATYTASYNKGFLTPNGTVENSPGHTHWLVKYPFYREILLDAGYQIILNDANSSCDQLHWKNSPKNKEKVQFAFAKLQKESKPTSCTKRCRTMSCSIVEEIKKQKLRAQTIFKWDVALHASACTKETCTHSAKLKEAFTTNTLRGRMNIDVFGSVAIMPHFRW